MVLVEDMEGEHQATTHNSGRPAINTPAPERNISRPEGLEEGGSVTNMIRNMNINLEPIDPETPDHEPTGDEVADAVNDLYAELSEAQLGHD